MKTRIISTLALMAGVLLSGCTREDMPEGGAPGDGNRVVFTLAGITPQQQNGRTRRRQRSGETRRFGRYRCREESNLAPRRGL